MGITDRSPMPPFTADLEQSRERVTLITRGAQDFPCVSGLLPTRP